MTTRRGERPGGAQSTSSTDEARLRGRRLGVEHAVDRGLGRAPELVPPGCPATLLHRLDLFDLGRPTVEERRPARAGGRPWPCHAGRPMRPRRRPRSPRRPMRPATPPPPGTPAGHRGARSPRARSVDRRCAAAASTPGTTVGCPHTEACGAARTGQPRAAATRSIAAPDPEPAPATITPRRPARSSTRPMVGSAGAGAGGRQAQAPAAPAAGRQGRGAPQQRLPERQVEVDGTRRRSRRFGVGTGGQRAPAGRGGLVRDARGVEPAHGPTEEVGLVDRLRARRRRAAQAGDRRCTRAAAPARGPPRPRLDAARPPRCRSS